jgi:hypothetical protein
MDPRGHCPVFSLLGGKGDKAATEKIWDYNCGFLEHLRSNSTRLVAIAACGRRR